MNQNLSPNQFRPSPRDVQTAVDVIGEDEVLRLAPGGLSGATPEQLQAIISASAKTR